MAMRPGGDLARRDIHFFFLLDGSGSMAGEKIQSLNYAVASAIPEMRSTADENPQARVLVRALKFADHVEWIVQEPTPLSEFQWQDIKAGGETAMGKALEAVAEALERLETEATDRRYLPPAIILVTDGHPTDDFEAGLRRLRAHPFGEAATRLAVAIGGTEAALGPLQDFIGNPRLKPLQAEDSAELVRLIKFASTSAIKHSSGLTSEDEWVSLGLSQTPGS